MGSHLDIWDGNLRTIFILNIKKKKQNHTELCVCFNVEAAQREPKL